MLLSLRGWRALSAEQADLRAELKARVGQILALDEDEAVAVNEISCFDPGCPRTETVVLWMRAGRPTRAMKVPARMAEVTDEAILVAALALADAPTV